MTVNDNSSKTEMERQLLKDPANEKRTPAKKEGCRSKKMMQYDKVPKPQCSGKDRHKRGEEKVFKNVYKAQKVKGYRGDLELDKLVSYVESDGRSKPKLSLSTEKRVTNSVRDEEVTAYDSTSEESQESSEEQDTVQMVTAAEGRVYVEGWEEEEEGPDGGGDGSWVTLPTKSDKAAAARKAKLSRRSRKKPRSGSVVGIVSIADPSGSFYVWSISHGVVHIKESLAREEGLRLGDCVYFWPEQTDMPRCFWAATSLEKGYHPADVEVHIAWKKKKKSVNVSGVGLMLGRGQHDGFLWCEGIGRVYVPMRTLGGVVIQGLRVVEFNAHSLNLKEAGPHCGWKATSVWESASQNHTFPSLRRCSGARLMTVDEERHTATLTCADLGNSMIYADLLSDFWTRIESKDEKMKNRLWKAKHWKMYVVRNSKKTRIPAKFNFRAVYLVPDEGNQVPSPVTSPPQVLQTAWCDDYEEELDFGEELDNFVGRSSSLCAEKSSSGKSSMLSDSPPSISEVDDLFANSRPPRFTSSAMDMVEKVLQAFSGDPALKSYMERNHSDLFKEISQFGGVRWSEVLAFRQA